MSLEKLFAKYISRLDDLIYRGQKISKDIRDEMRNQAIGSIYGDEYHRDLDIEEMAEPNSIPQYELALQEWKITVKTLLNHLLPEGSIHHDIFKELVALKVLNINQKDCAIIESFISKLRAIRDDLGAGFLGNLELQIEAEIAADYMGQAEQLLAEGATGQYDHVPAAVLAGAVLEKEIRALCLKQMPPLPLYDTKGKNLMMNRLIDDLKKIAVFNELKAKQLRAWVDIRNKAAHGEFEQFNKKDVETMIRGINIFLADYLQ